MPELRRHHEAPEQRTRGATDRAETAVGLGGSGRAGGCRHRCHRRRSGRRDELPEAIYRTVTARLDGRRLQPADVDLLNERASGAQLTPRLLRTGATRRDGTPSQLLTTLAADLLDPLAGTDIDNVKRCVHPDCTRLHVDASRAKNRRRCGMGTCGNKAKVQAFHARQRAASG
jgi:predicted RNA-binding Zn ribbon-like protein